ncbi:hypothetical protein V2I22_05520 [Campylobacter sp. CLAX-7218-21]|uniref:hypothetical protein n=1 Tax=Campylobacter devanensis TaxID=3161138 RepID=UPI002EA3F70B|nr:hypothetical protein [Campylobacter sp. CLAX-7218-21]
MIIATIQNLKKGDEQILAKDGVILSGYEREVTLNKFFNDIFEIELKDNTEECFFLMKISFFAIFIIRSSMKLIASVEL